MLGSGSLRPVSASVAVNGGNRVAGRCAATDPAFDPGSLSRCPCQIVFLEIAPRDRDMNAAHQVMKSNTTIRLFTADMGKIVSFTAPRATQKGSA
jgi:hypothetical protein